MRWLSIGRRRKEASQALLLLVVAAFEVVFEDLHDGEEAAHLVEAVGQLGFPSSGASEASLRISEATAEIVHRRRRCPIGEIVFR